MDIISLILSGLLSAFFLLASTVKIFAWQKMIFERQLEFFHSYGLNRQIMFGVGVIELFGALGIWLAPSYIGLAAILALFCTSIGAIFFHLKFDTWKDGSLAMITLTFSLIVLVLQAPTDLIAKAL